MTVGKNHRLEATPDMGNPLPSPPGSHSMSFYAYRGGAMAVRPATRGATAIRLLIPSRS